jgi:hypothetical protein
MKSGELRLARGFPTNNLYAFLVSPIVVTSSSSLALQPRSSLGLPYGLHDSYSTMWVISSTIDLVLDTLI